MRKLLLALVALLISLPLWADYSVSVSIVVHHSPVWVVSSTTVTAGDPDSGGEYSYVLDTSHWEPVADTYETQTITISGPTPSDTSSRLAAVQSITTAIVAVEAKAAIAIAGDPAVISVAVQSPALVGQSISFENGNVTATVNLFVEKKNATQGGDPVRLATGKQVTEETDLVVPVDGLFLAVARGATTGQSGSGSFGTVWASSLDSRIIWGIKQNSSQISGALHDQVEALSKTYDDAKSAYDAQYGTEQVPGYYDQQIAALKLDRAGYIADLGARTTAQGQASYPEVKQAYQGSIDALNSLISSLNTAIDTTLPNAKADFKTTYEKVVKTHWTEYSNKLGEYNHALNEQAMSTLNAARNQYSYHSGDPLSWELVGLNHVILVGEDGVGQVLTLVTEPDFTGASTYADKTANYFPSGSPLTGLEGTGETAILTGDGKFLWTKKNGEVWTYDLNGLLIHRADAHGNTLDYHYDANHALVSITDRRQRTLLTVFPRDGAGRITKITDIADRSVCYKYDDTGLGQLTKVQDVDGDTVTYGYTGGTLSQIVKPDSSHLDYAISAGRTTSTSDEEGNTETFEYNNDDPAHPYTVHTAAHAAGSSDDSPSVWDKHYYDPEKFYDLRVEYSDGTAVTYTYDNFGRVKTETWDSGLARTFVFDENGNLRERKNFDGTSETWKYWDNNVLRLHIDGQGNTTSFSEDGYDTTEVDYNDGSSEKYLYHRDGTIDTATNAKGGVRTFEPDTNGFIASVSYTGSPNSFDEKFTNDALGRVTVYRDQAKVNTHYAYRPDGSIQSVLYPDGRAKVFTYNNRKDKTREETRLYPNSTGDQVASLSPSDFNNSTKFVVLDHVTFEYDQRHLLKTLTNSLGQTVSYTYYGSGKVKTKEIKDEKGVRYSLLTYVYNGGGEVDHTVLVGKGIPTSLTRQYQYGPNGKVSRELDERGVWKQYNYDPVTGQLSSIQVLSSGTDPDKGTWMTISGLAYQKGLLSQADDWHGTSRQFSYDNRGRLQKVEAKWQGSWSPLEEYHYDASGGVSDRVDGGMTETQWDYDVWGNAIVERNALALKDGRNASTQVEYDGRGLVTKMTNDVGLVTEYLWDNLRRLKTITEKDSSGKVLNTDSRVYRFAGTQLAMDETDKRGVTRTTLYDALGRVAQEINGYGKTKSYEYNVLSKVTTITDETGRITRFDYDGLGRLLSEQQGSQLVGTYTYDGQGNLLTKTDGENRVTSYTYDFLGRLLEESQGSTPPTAALVTDYVYDDTLHQVTRTTGAFTHVYSYDEWAHLSSETDATGNTQSYKYNNLGKMTGKTDYKGQKWVYGYDVLNRLQLVTVGSKVMGNYQYDPLGNLTSISGPDSTIGYKYDIQGNLFQQQDDSGTLYTFGYDAGGLRTTRQRGSKGPLTSYTYGKEGELLGLVDGNNNGSTFVYDDAGREIQVIESNGMTKQTQYDDVGRVSFMRESKTEARDKDRKWDQDEGHGWGRESRSPVWGEAYAYNDAGQVVLKADLNGEVTFFDYDQAGRLSTAQYSYDHSGRPELFGRDLDRDHVFGRGNNDNQRSPSIKSQVKTLLGDVYYQMGGFSSVDWNQKLWKETYMYDPAGNRNQIVASKGTLSFQYDTNNRLTNAGNRSYTYDANGNQLTETNGDETVSMTYTEDNRLKSYQRTTTVSTDGEDEDVTPQIVSYSYDPLGRRISKGQTGREGVKSQGYQYEGPGLDLIRIADVQNLATSTAQSDTLTLLKKPLVDNDRVKVLRPRSQDQDETNGMDILYANGRVFSSVSNGKGLTIYGTDMLGSVRFTTNNRRTDSHEYDYDAWGESLGKKPEVFGFNGKVYDPATRNYDYGFRDYAPKQARFTTVDPIQDGSNWYVYCSNDPVNFTDPTGLSSGDTGNWVKKHGFQENFGTASEPYPHAGEDWVYIVKGENKTIGAAVYSLYDGTVEEAVTGQKKDDSRLGNLVRIRTPDGAQYNTFHYTDTVVTPGQKITKGDLLGHAGNTGTTSEGPHLHDEVRYATKPKNVDASQTVARYDQFYVDPIDY
jgi:RHS repeat-associated protein